MRTLSRILPSGVLLPFVLLGTALQLRGQTAGTFVPYSDVKPIFDTLRPDLLPSDLRDRTAAEREALWPAWVARRDAEVRARVAAGDDDSVVNFLLYGTAFTGRPRATDRDISELVNHPDEGIRTLRVRIDDFVAGLASPGTNERLQFARDVVRRHGVDPATPAGRREATRYFEQRLKTMESAGASRTRALLDASATELADKLTLFRDRGLSSDTSIFIDLGVDETLDGITHSGLLAPGSVRRVAIVGPGLDFSDKLEGYDFYPPQTIQPFAVIDSLLRLGLAKQNDLRVSAFDVSPRVLQHLDAARGRARAGRSYGLVLPRNLDQPWTDDLVKYWQRAGDTVGQKAPAPSPPPGAGRVDVRSVLVRPSVVLSITPIDLNVVLQRFDPPVGERFDLVVATNILLYYDVFEQSIAAANIARMLRPGGFFLTNNRVFELPAVPLTGVGFTDATYMALAGIGDTGDRIIWYRR